MKKELLCLVVASAMLTACGKVTDTVSSVAGAVSQQVKEAITLLTLCPF